MIGASIVQWGASFNGERHNNPKKQKTMTTLARRNQNWLPSIFDEILNNEFVHTSNAAPAVNIKENTANYTVDVAVPGMLKEDCKISIDDYNNLVISVEKKNEEKCENAETHYLRREFSYAKFQQAFVLPKDVDKEKIEAKVENGILAVTLPKFAAGEEKGHRLIEIQ